MVKTMTRSIPTWIPLAGCSDQLGNQIFPTMFIGTPVTHEHRGGIPFGSFYDTRPRQLAQRLPVAALLATEIPDRDILLIGDLFGRLLRELCLGPRTRNELANRLGHRPEESHALTYGSWCDKCRCLSDSSRTVAQSDGTGDIYMLISRIYRHTGSGGQNDG